MLPLNLALIFFLSTVAGASVAPLPGSLQTSALERILPKEYWAQILPEAQKLSLAKDFITKKQYAKAKATLKKLREQGYFRDIALYESANLDLKILKQPLTARESLEKLIIDFPTSALSDRAKILLAETEFDQGANLLRETKNLRGAAKLAKLKTAADWIRRGLDRISWKDWSDYEIAITNLLSIYKSLESPLYDGFYGEALNALPVTSATRQKLLQQIPSEKKSRILLLAQHFSGNGNGNKGTKAIQPDEELFKNALEKILDTKWDEALDTLQLLKTTYTDSLEMERVDYWIAICLEALGRPDAKDQFTNIFQNSTLSYYALEASVRAQLQLSSVVANNPPTVSDKLDGNLLPQQLLYLWRSRALLQVKQLEYARQEMDALFRYSPGGWKFGQSAAQGSLALAILFSEGQYFPGAFFHVRAALQKDAQLYSRETLNLFFPKTYLTEIKSAAKTFALDPLLLLSVTKQESAFIPDARSSAQALGLMQILLSTAVEIQDKLNKKQLLEPGRNISIGSEYLKKLLVQFDGNTALALAAYNAGPTRVKRWWEEMRTRPIFANGFRADAFIELIPYKETRGYVSSILRNYAWYKFLDKEELSKENQ